MPVILHFVFSSTETETLLQTKSFSVVFYGTVSKYGYTQYILTMVTRPPELALTARGRHSHLSIISADEAGVTHNGRYVADNDRPNRQTSENKQRHQQENATACNIKLVSRRTMKKLATLRINTVNAIAST
jgi:hypothetical protein